MTIQDKVFVLNNLKEIADSIPHEYAVKFQLHFRNIFKILNGLEITCACGNSIDSADAQMCQQCLDDAQ